MVIAGSEDRMDPVIGETESDGSADGDRSAFAAYCQSYARWKETQEHINSEGATYETENGMQRPNPWVAICNTEQRLMMQAASEFGLTPSARSRIMAASGVDEDEEDEMEALLGGEA